MAEFSYEADIAPMRGSYFTNPNLSDAERKQLQAGYMEKVAPYQEITNKTLGRILDAQNQELSFRRANIAFEEEKLKLQQERDFAQKYPDMAKQLGDALEGKDPNDQRIVVADLAVKNPAFFASKNGSALLSAVDAKISATVASQADNRAKANQVWSMAAQLGAPEIGKKVTAGEITPDEGAKQLAAYRQEIEALENKQKLSKEMADRAYKARAEYVDKTESLFNTIKYADGSSDSFDPNQIDINKGGAVPTAKPKPFAQPYRNALISRVITLSDLDPEQEAAVRKLPDNELHNLLGRRVEDNKKQLYRDIYNDTGNQSELIPTRRDLTKSDYLRQNFSAK